ncbi:MAG: NAD(P)H-binding protein [Deltaproteobacteria bacterium]|nr:NAD(P)H-binding protein [Deltaproteobacteria bacterium]
MKLVVLGASGGVGRLLVASGKARGHHITAVGRANSKLEEIPEVRVLRGDLTDQAFLERAVEGQDVVLSALGLKLAGIAPWNKPEDPEFLAHNVTALVAAMKAQKVSRVCAISSGGVGDSMAMMPGFFKAFVALSAMRTVLARLDEMEQVYFASGLDVCVVRPSGLTDGEASGKVVIAKRFVGRATISRADVAEYMLDQLSTAPFAHKSPVITVTGAG